MHADNIFLLKLLKIFDLDIQSILIENRNLIAWNFININNPTESVDIILTEDLKKVKTKIIKSRDKILKVVSIGDLIKMKKRSGEHCANGFMSGLEDILRYERMQRQEEGVGFFGLQKLLFE